MTLHRYTTEEIAALTALAIEARQIENEAHEVLAQAKDKIDQVAGYNLTSGTRKIDWTMVPEVLDEAMAQDFSVAPYEQLPQAGQVAYNRIHRAAEWAKVNNRARRAIKKLEKALS